MTIQTYRVVFDRIGGQHNAPPLVTRADGAEQLADAIIDRARKYLLSPNFVVSVDLGRLRGDIAVTNGHEVGTFTIEEIHIAAGDR